MGGLAVPSIAVSNKETDYINFGNITLLMSQDVVNPKETPVYTRDAWTAVFPIHTVDTAKKRVGALEDIKNTLNKAGLKEDIMVKVLLSEEAYEKAYKPTVEALMQINGNIQEAARDSALIYARMIGSRARNYKLPVENIVVTISTHGAYQNGMYGSPVTEVYAGNETFDAVNLDILPDKIGSTGKDEESKQQVANIINNMFRNEQVTTADLKALLNLKGIDNVNTWHIVHAFSQNHRRESGVRARVIRNKAISNFNTILRNAVLVEFANKYSTKNGYFAAKEHDAKVKGTMRFIVPYALVITAEVSSDHITFDKTPATVYGVYDRQIKTARPDQADLKSSGLGEKITY